MNGNEPFPPRRKSDRCDVNRSSAGERALVMTVGGGYAIAVIVASFYFTGERAPVVATAWIVVPAIVTCFLPAMRGFAAGALAILAVGWLLLGGCWMFAESMGLNDL
jgi:hypothetical protein